MVDDAEADQPNSHRTVDRIAAVLDRLAESPDGCTLTELAAACKAPLTTMQGIAQGLVHNGYADRQKRRYFLGRATYLLNRRAGRELLPGLSRDLLIRLHTKVGLSVVLSVRIGRVGYYIDHRSDDPNFSYLAEDLLERPLLENAAGWVHLASLEPAVMWSHLDSCTDQSRLVTQFLRHKNAIARTDMCIAPSISPHAAGIAMGIRTNGRLLSVVSVIGERADIANNRKAVVDALAAERHRQTTDT